MVLIDGPPSAKTACLKLHFCIAFVVNYTWALVFFHPVPVLSLSLSVAGRGLQLRKGGNSETMWCTSVARVGGNSDAFLVQRRLIRSAPFFEVVLDPQP